MPERPVGALVELLYFDGCPSHESFLPHLRELLTELGVDDPIRLVEITDDDEAHRQRFLGSPSLRIDGVDVEPAAAGRTDYGMQCRIYVTEDGARGSPPDAWIAHALGEETGSPRRPDRS